MNDGAKGVRPAALSRDVGRRAVSTAGGLGVPTLPPVFRQREGEEPLRIVTVTPPDGRQKSTHLGGFSRGVVGACKPWTAFVPLCLCAVALARARHDRDQA